MSSGLQHAERSEKSASVPLTRWCKLPKPTLRQWACDLWVERLEVLLAGWEGAGHREHV